MKVSRRAQLIIALVLWIPIVSFLAYFFLYEPVKFSYLIHRVESANTPAGERAESRTETWRRATSQLHGISRALIKLMRAGHF